MQDPHADADPATSEGVFVYTGSAPDRRGRRQRDGVRHGRASTTRAAPPPACSRSPRSPSPSVTVVSSGNPVPAPVRPRQPQRPGRLRTAAPPAATSSTLTAAARRIRPRPVRVAGGHERRRSTTPGWSAPSDAYGELWVTVKPRQNRDRARRHALRALRRPELRPPQGAVAGPDRPAAVPQRERRRRADRRHQRPAGLQPVRRLHPGRELAGHRRPPAACARRSPRKQRTGQLALATYNVENLAPGDPTASSPRWPRASSPTSSRPTSWPWRRSRTTTAPPTTARSPPTRRSPSSPPRSRAAGGPAYDWRSIDPVNDQDGGEPGGNIRQVFLFNPQRVAFDDIAGGERHRVDRGHPVGGHAQLTASPGRIDPANPPGTPAASRWSGSSPSAARRSS